VFFASNKPIVTCFDSQSNVKKLITSEKDIKCTFVHLNVKYYCDKICNINITNFSSVHFIIQNNTSLVRVLHDENTNHETLWKPNHFIHMFSIVFKRSNPFTTTHKRSSMKVFCFLSDFSCVVIQLIIF